MRGTLATLVLAAQVLAAAIPRGAMAQSSGPKPSPTSGTYRTHADVEPPLARIGQRVTYRGWVIVPRGQEVRWLPAAIDSTLSWGPIRSRRSVVEDGGGSHVGVYDTVTAEATIQAFRPRELSVPGLGISFPGKPSPIEGEPALPVVRLTVVPTLTAADSNATLRPLRGPLVAPWWERVPWRWVLLGLVLIAAIVAVVMRMRRRPAVVPVVPINAPVRSVDPSTEALAALAALRALRLPEQGHYDQHAFQLTRIVRRFLERVFGAPRPGDTTEELVERLRDGRLGVDAVARLERLLRAWDLVKFAREPSSLDESRRAEDAVEALIRRPANQPPREAA